MALPLLSRDDQQFKAKQLIQIRKAVSVLKNMVVSHGLMLWHKDQIERELTRQPPKPPA